jgi:hypothetical protein
MASAAVSERAARAVYVDVCRVLGFEPHPEVRVQGDGTWPYGPVLVRDFALWGEAVPWAVVFEGGPFEWVMLREVDAVPMPDGLFMEPLCSFAMAIHEV